MPDSTPGARTLSSIWGSIQSAVRDPNLRAQPGGVTQYVWEALKQSYAARGEQLSGVTIQDVNRAVSQAGAQVRADQALSAALDTYNRTGIDQSLTSAMWQPDIDSRSLSDQPLGPNYRIRFDINVLAGGEPITLTYTYEPGLIPPQSTSDLLGMLGEAGAGAAEDYGLEFQSLGGSISISTV